MLLKLYLCLLFRLCSCHPEIISRLVPVEGVYYLGEQGLYLLEERIDVAVVIAYPVLF